MSKKSSESAKRETPPECERCDSKKVVPILWGFPSEETFTLYEGCRQENKEPPFWLGGCCVTDDDPKWHCLGCGHEFGLRDQP